MRQIIWLGQGVGFVLLASALAGSRVTGIVLLGVGAAFILSQLLIARLLASDSARRIARYEQTAHESEDQRHQIELLFAMTDMLQSAESHEDAGEVLQATASQLLPDLGGALFIFNNSEDRLDMASCWPKEMAENPLRSLVPANCWAIKRGKFHVNDPEGGGLCCKHVTGEFATIEVPMIARGKVHGLLILISAAEDGANRLRAVSRIAQALADSMSLALANIGLQEKLRTQSLRDPLTGLYNRRYMEDALERYLNIAERNGSPTSVIMLDLDHFKKLNDTHGHAKGDAVLRDVSAQLVAAVRPADVVARYGGEELIVIMPGCSLDDAMLKADMLRARIEGLSELHGTPVTASFGVATVPTTASAMSDVVPMADAALYAAKQAGRNCVHAAKRRHAEGDKRARLAVG